MIPIYSFVAWSGTGKTTYLERLIPALKGLGLRVAAVKHDAHEFEIDHRGKDSWRLTHAGAEVTAVVSGTQAAFMEARTLDMEAVLDRIRDVDLILTEGYKQGPWPKIALVRAATGRGPALPLEVCAALVTDGEPEADIPVFPLDDPAPLARWLETDRRKYL